MDSGPTLKKFPISRRIGLAIIIKNANINIDRKFGISIK
jgi:hypothetical protein